jgi:hypothetical protein
MVDWMTIGLMMNAVVTDDVANDGWIIKELVKQISQIPDTKIGEEELTGRCQQSPISFYLGAEYL